MDALRLLGRYAVVSWRAQMQYPVSALLLTGGHLLATGIEFIAAWALFQRFGSVGGWTLGGVALFYGLVNVAFSLADLMTRGFDVLGNEFIRTGNFDRILLRPRSATLQLIGHEFRLSRLGRMAQGLAAIAISTGLTGLDWDPGAVATAIWAVMGGAALFSGLFVLQATLAFWTIESLEVANVLTYGGVQAAQYPLDIYANWFRSFLIFVVPLGCVTYYPALAIFDRSDPLGAPSWLLPLAPAVGFLFLGLSFLAWRFGVARYTSTGS
jgi:ABC-2 type transport system permease protein